MPLKTQFLKSRFIDGTFTDQNNLASALLIEPEIADTLIYTFGSGNATGKFGGDKYNIVSYLTQGSGRTTTDYRVSGNDEIIWAVMGNLTKPQPISGQVVPATDTGINFTEFSVPFPERYFSLGDVCRFESGNQARVCQEPYKQGNNWIYIFQIMGNDPTEVIPALDLEEGREVSWVTTRFEEGSEGGGSKEATPMWFRNNLSIERMAWGMTGGAKTDVIVFQVERDGKKRNLWLYEKQFMALRNWNRQHERSLWFSRGNRLPDGTFPILGANGRPIKSGSGIEEQISGTNTIVTNTLTEEMFWHLTLDVIAASNEADNIKRTIITGNGGVWAFQQAMRKSAERLQQIDTNFVHKLGGNKLAFGAEYTTYRGPQGGEFTIINHPMFNDKTLFPRLDPVNNFTDYSYKMFFCDFSDYGGKSNIEFISKGANGENRKLMQWFTAGATTPDFNGDTGVSKMMRSNAFDGFMCYTLSETGVIVRNPFGCGLIDIRPAF